MLHTLEILGNNKKISVSKGFIEVSTGNNTTHTIPIDSIGIVLTNGFGISYTHNALIALAENAIPLVLCNNQQYPHSILLPLESHGSQSKIHKAQVRLSLPKQKQLWKQIIQSKIRGHCNILQYYCIDSSPLEHLINKVQSGDTSNIEGHAASVYWKLLFSSSFRRNQDGHDSINIMLNYSYTVLRALVAKAVVTSGLHYSFGIYHSNSRNSMPLVDDMMEPFRCFSEKLVMEAIIAGHKELNKESKKILQSIGIIEVAHEHGISIAYECIKRICVSLAKFSLKEVDELTVHNQFKI